MKQVMKLAEPTRSSIMKPNGKENSFQSLPASQQFLTRTCVRCAGLLVSEWSYDLQNPFTHNVESLRCVQCGNRIDPVILQNQLRPFNAFPSKREDRHTRIAPLEKVA